MRTARVISILFLAILLSANAFAQKAKVSSTLDAKSIMIGEQFRMKLKVELDDKSRILWPELMDTITKNVEIVEVGKTDTVFSENKKRITYNKDYILTSFDSGAFNIPALTFTAITGSATETIRTSPLFIRVNKPEVDTTKGIMDIKGPLEIPFDWTEYIPHVLVGFAAVLVIVLAFYFIRKALRKRRMARENKPVYVPPPIPAHEVALTALKQLEEKQLWQQGKTKQYYTEITDILRDYIQDIYHVNAPEMLTDEILQYLKIKEMEIGHRLTLKSVLETADMVKFAKVTPTEIENGQVLIASVKFVEETAPKPEINTKKGDLNG